MAKAVLSVDELVALLKKTSLPTVIIEGTDDTIVYRRLEDIYGAHMLDILPVGGRSALIELYNRRIEFDKSAKVVFAADKDHWVFLGVPAAYVSPSVVLTDGYAIENDVLRDVNFRNIMTLSERAAFEEELATFLKWYGPKVDRFLAGASECLSDHPTGFFEQCRKGLIVPDNLSPVSQSPNGMMISNAAERLLRGKTLMGLVMRQLSAHGRAVKFSKQNLLEMAGANPGVHVARLFADIGSALQFDAPVARA